MGWKPRCQCNLKGNTMDEGLPPPCDAARSWRRPTFQVAAEAWLKWNAGPSAVPLPASISETANGVVQ